MATVTCPSCRRFLTRHFVADHDNSQTPCPHCEITLLLDAGIAAIAPQTAPEQLDSTVPGQDIEAQQQVAPTVEDTAALVQDLFDDDGSLATDDESDLNLDAALSEWGHETHAVLRAPSPFDVPVRASADAEIEDPVAHDENEASLEGVATDDRAAALFEDEDAALDDSAELKTESADAPVDGLHAASDATEAKAELPVALAELFDEADESAAVLVPAADLDDVSMHVEGAAQLTDEHRVEPTDVWMTIAELEAPVMAERLAKMRGSDEGDDGPGGVGTLDPKTAPGGDAMRALESEAAPKRRFGRKRSETTVTPAGGDAVATPAPSPEPPEAKLAIAGDIDEDRDSASVTASVIVLDDPVAVVEILDLDEVGPSGDSDEGLNAEAAAPPSSVDGLAPTSPAAVPMPGDAWIARASSDRPRKQLNTKAAQKGGRTPSAAAVGIGAVVGLAIATFCLGLFFARRRSS